MADEALSPPHISRQVALASGARFYFTGNACAQGHIELRRASSSACLACERAKLARVRAAYVSDPARTRRYYLRQKTLEARALRAAGMSASAIGRAFGVNRKTVDAAAAGRNWRHVTARPLLTERAKAALDSQARHDVSSASSPDRRTCANGHPWTAETTWLSGRKRQCRICNREAVARYGRRKRQREKREAGL